MSNAITFICGFALLILFIVYLSATNERMKRILGGIFTVYVVALMLVAVYPPFDVKDADGKVVKPGTVTLGIDLKGGTSFLCRLKPAQNDDGTFRPIGKQAVDQAVEVIRTRIDKMGTSEPIITPTGEEMIMVQIPGLPTEMLDAVRKQLEQVAKLEFRMVHLQSEFLLRQIEAKTEILDPAYEVLDYVHEQGGKKVTDKLVVAKKIEITGDKVKDAYATVGETGGWDIALRFNSEGEKLFGDVTARMAANKSGRERFAILMDRVVIQAAGLSEKAMQEGGIRGGSCVITGDRTEQEARNVSSALLNPLENPLVIEEQRASSASLGEDAIKSGTSAGLLGIALITLGMLIYYRIPGIYANIALCVTVTVIFGTIALLHAVLTLPGIAGVILTLGIAVDANVLIFERLREELASGKSFRTAVDHAFDRAFTAIFDANVTTLISAFILYLLATGPVKGFAIALTIGVIAALFSSLVVTRWLFVQSIESFKLGRVKMLNIMPGTNVNFLGFRKIALSLSALVIVGSMGLFVAKGDKMYSIDFKGGDLLVLEAHGTKPSDGDVRALCESLGVKDTVVQTEKSQLGTELVNIRSPKDTGLKIKAAMMEKFADAKFKVSQEETVGPLVGSELKKTSATALGLGILATLIYITLRFELSFAIGAITALMHDVLITIGCFALFGRELSLITVGAILTIGGYSVNDTIVVFDRIREGIKSGKPGTLQDIMNRSINDMLGRTFMTSGSTMLPSIGLFLFGGPVLHDFAFTVCIGVLTGTYSSVFIAAPIVLWWSGRGGRNLKSEVRKRDEEAAVPA